jgi:hypothetical protein
MDARSGRPAEAHPDGDSDAHPDTDAALEFVRFCRRRRKVPWPEMYDEMCAVAARRLFRDWGFAELAEHGVAFTLFDTPGLAALVTQVCREERERALERERTQELERGAELELTKERLVSQAPAG